LAFAKCCGDACSAALAILLGLFAAGAAVTAKAMTPATNTAAAILTIGLNIVSPCIHERMDEQRGHGSNVPRPAK
jgi:hypothetical protein